MNIPCPVNTFANLQQNQFTRFKIFQNIMFIRNVWNNFFFTLVQFQFRFLKKNLDSVPNSLVRFGLKECGSVRIL